MEGSASPICWKTVSPEEASAPKAAMKPSMANLPLTVSGALPAKAMASPKVGGEGDGGLGDGLGGEHTCLLLSFASLRLRFSLLVRRWATTAFVLSPC